MLDEDAARVLEDGVTVRRVWRRKSLDFVAEKGGTA
jgi:hypothetical protein